MSRITAETNALGTWGYNYVDDVSGSSKGTLRLSSINYPNSQTTNFSYFGNTGDQRLMQISNLDPSSNLLSQFSYQYDPSGRAECGRQVIETLRPRLNLEYGRGFNRAALLRMVQFAEQFPDWKIVATLSRKLGWSHFVELLPLENEIKRNFYAEMCAIESWSVRSLRAKVK